MPGVEQVVIQADPASDVMEAVDEFSTADLVESSFS